MYLNFHVSLNICCLFWIQSRLWALTQNQLTRYQRTRIGSFEIWNNSCISMNLAYLRETWPLLVLSNWYLGSNFFGKGSDTSFTFLRCHCLFIFISWSWVKTQTTLCTNQWWCKSSPACVQEVVAKYRISGSFKAMLMFVRSSGHMDRPTWFLK